MTGLSPYFSRKINKGNLDLRGEPVRDANYSGRDDED